MKNIILLLFITFLCASCDQGYDRLRLNGIGERKLEKHLIDPSRDTVVYCAKGTKFFIENTSFNSSEQLDTVVIELVTIHTPGDMILNGIETTCQDKVIESDGMIYISALSSSGHPVQLAKSIIVELPVRNKLDVPLFFQGTEDSNGITWEQSMIDSITTVELVGIYAVGDDVLRHYSDGSQTSNSRKIGTYCFELDRFGWMNCDAFIENSSSRSIEIETFENEIHFVVYTEINSVVKGNYVENTTHFNNLPDQGKVLLFSLMLEGSDTLMSLTTFNKVGDLKNVISPRYRKVSEADILTTLSKF